MTTKADKLIDRRINAAYCATCQGVQVNVMDIGKVFAEGKRAIAEGADEDQLRARIVAFVETIRQN